MRVGSALGQFLDEPCLELGADEVFEAFGGFVEVVGGEFEVFIEEGFPQAMRTHE